MAIIYSVASTEERDKNWLRLLWRRVIDFFSKEIA